MGVVHSIIRARAVPPIPEMAAVQRNWSLGSLGYSDERADDLSDCFNFSQTPLPYKPVTTLYTKEQLMHAWRFEPPDND